MAFRESVPSQCGMRHLYELDTNDNIQKQIEDLENALAGVTQVILTDTTKEEKTRWAATKSVCYQGPSTMNPNSGNHIKIYIATTGSLAELRALAKKKRKN
jgi:hypothetical protein